MYFAIFLVFFVLTANNGAQMSELRCYECENCPGPIKDDVPIIKCHEGNVISSTTEAGTTLETTEDESSYYNGPEQDSEESLLGPENSVDDSEQSREEEEEEESSNEEEYEFTCYSMEVEDASGTVVTNRGCAIKLEQDNETCALANYESTEYVSCKVCTEDVCNRAKTLAPSMYNLLKALTPIIIILLLIT